MKQYKLIMTPKQHQLLAKHLGELDYMYRTILKHCDEKDRDEMKQYYQTNLNEVRELVDLLLAVFKNMVNDNEEKDNKTN